MVVMGSGFGVSPQFKGLSEKIKKKILFLLENYKRKSYKIVICKCNKDNKLNLCNNTKRFLMS